MNIAGVVLAGGQSKRMGIDKSLLKTNNKTLLQHASDILFNSGIKNIFISGDTGIQDKYPDKGPIGGILSCLLILKEYTHVLFIPVDMPLITNEIIIELVKTQINDLAHYQNNNLPLIIENSSYTRKTLEIQIKNKKLSIYELIDKLDSIVLKNGHKQELFMNTNTPEQWQIATRRLLK